MEVRSEKTKSHEVEMTVEVPYERWAAIRDKEFKDYTKEVKIKGFRPGRVPMGMIKKRFGEVIIAQAAKKAMDEFYREALDKSEHKPLAPGEISDLDFGDDKPFTFKAVFQIMPEIKVEGYDKLITYIDEVEIGDDEIETGLENLREENAVMLPMEGAVDEHSVVTIDIQELDNTGIPILTHCLRDIVVELGKNDLGQEFDNAAVGKEIGDVFKISVDAGGDRNRLEDASSGQPIQKHFQITVKDIKRKELPELDDEFSRSVNEKFHILDDLRKGIKDHLVLQSASRAKSQMYTRITNILIENNRIDVPPVMLDDYLKRLLENTRKDNPNLNEEEFKENYRQSAIWNLKWFLLRKAIIKQENLEAVKSEIDAEIEKIIQSGGGTPEAWRKHFSVERNYNRVKDDIEERKTLAFIESKTRITTRKIGYREFVEKAG